jgi:hypothetical protein
MFPFATYLQLEVRLNQWYKNFNLRFRWAGDSRATHTFCQILGRG